MKAGMGMDRCIVRCESFLDLPHDLTLMLERLCRVRQVPVWTSIIECSRQERAPRLHDASGCLVGMNVQLFEHLHSVKIVKNFNDQTMNNPDFSNTRNALSK